MLWFALSLCCGVCMIFGFERMSLNHPQSAFAKCQEAKIVLATVLRNFDFTPVQIPPLGQEMVYHVLARPRDGVHVRAHRRWATTVTVLTYWHTVILGRLRWRKRRPTDVSIFFSLYCNVFLVDVTQCWCNSPRSAKSCRRVASGWVK